LESCLQDSIHYEDDWECTAAELICQDSNDWADTVEVALAQLLDAARYVQISEHQHVRLLWNFSNYPGRHMLDSTNQDEAPEVAYDKEWSDWSSPVEDTFSDLKGIAERSPRIEKIGRGFIEGKMMDLNFSHLSLACDPNLVDLGSLRAQYSSKGVLGLEGLSNLALARYR